LAQRFKRVDTRFGALVSAPGTLGSPAGPAEQKQDNDETGYNYAVMGYPAPVRPGIAFTGANRGAPKPPAGSR